MEIFSSYLLNDSALENYYRLNDLTDSSSKGRNLSITGSIGETTGVFGAGKTGTFDASNYLSATGFSLGTGSCSMGCFFKKSSAPTADYTPTILAISNAVGDNRLYLCADKTTGILNVRSYNGSTNPNAYTSLNVCDGNWHFLVTTRNATSMSIYCDGVLLVNTAITVQNLTTTQFNIGCGIRGATTDYISAAYYDEIFSMSRELTLAEVSYLYNGKLADNYLKQYRRTRSLGLISGI